MTNPVDRFLKQYWADREAKKVRPLREYLDLFPGEDNRIATEYLALESSPGTEDPDRVGPYRLEREIGRGGQGRVYLATDTRHGRSVALKVLTELSSAEQLKRFAREAKLGARLDHPGICPVYDSGLDGRTPYIAMRYVEGTTLATRISTQKSGGAAEAASPSAATHVILEPRSDDAPGEWTTDHHPSPGPGAEAKTTRSGSVTPREMKVVLCFFEDAARALHAAHEKGVVHRDIKPGNIMIDQDLRPVLMDFGLARSDDEDLVTLTKQGDLFGTPAYMSPEQLTHHAIRMDRRTDIWSLGVSLYESLTLRRPFEAPTREGLYQVIQGKEPESPRRWNPAISADLATVVLKCLEKDRDRRYDTGAALADELGRVRRHEPILARPVGPLGRILRWRQRNPAMAASLGAALLILLVGGLVSSAFAIRANRNAEEAADNARRAQDSTNQADRNLQEWARLADGRVLADLVREANEDLWPAVPARIPAMDIWRRNAEKLVARLPDHERTLEAIRAQAAPYDETAQYRDFSRWLHTEDGAQLGILRNQIDHLRGQIHVRRAEAAARAAAAGAEGSTAARQAQSLVDQAEEDCAALQVRQRELEAKRDRLLESGSRFRLTWSFSDPDARFRHKRLKELVEGLRTLQGPADPGTVTIEGIAARFALARSLERTHVSESRAWEAVRASIAAPSSPYYESLVPRPGRERWDPTLTPLPGLVPLGIDEDSNLWEFWHVASGARPSWVGTPLGTGRVRLRTEKNVTGDVGEEGIVLVLLPGGSFRMGARRPGPLGSFGNPNLDPDAESDESYARAGALDPFFLSKYEVTQGQWQRLRGSNPSTILSGGSGTDPVTLRNPVTDIDWEEARESCRRWNLELPTEAQWEYACRGGTRSVYWTGNDLRSLQGAANLADRTAQQFTPWQTEPDFEDGLVFHGPVDCLRPNSFGLHHVHGNVREWCLDGYHEYTKTRLLPRRGLREPIDSAGARDRVNRGGSFRDIAHYARSAARNRNDLGHRSNDLGLRPARSIEN
jgi:serine/threonine protein kinase/formylglycine-generating enzyme required for sulfatase activity